MASIYTNISENKWNSYVLIAVFITVVSLLIWFMAYIVWGVTDLTFAGLALVLTGIYSYISYYFSGNIVMAVSKAREVPEQEMPELHKLVENMTIASGLPKPKIYVIDDTAMNAFATGRDPEHAMVCFTTGILSRLEKRELEGVVAHEMSHIGNYDIRFMSLVTVLVGVVTLLADLFTRGMMYGGRSRRSDSNGPLFIVGILFILLSPLISSLIKLALSRQREYLADATAAMMTRYPKGLADALAKISADPEILEAANGATAHLYIANPLKGDIAGTFSKLFSTHPPVEERIKRLMEM